MTKFTANDYQNIIKVILFVIDNLYVNYKKKELLYDKLCKIFHIYLKIYMIICQKLFTDMELAKLQINIKSLNVIQILNSDNFYFFLLDIYN